MGCNGRSFDNTGRATQVNLLSVAGHIYYRLHATCYLILNAELSASICNGNNECIYIYIYTNSFCQFLWSLTFWTILLLSLKIWASTKVAFKKSGPIKIGRITGTL